MIRILLGFLPKLFLGLLDRWGWRRAGIEAERRRNLEDAIGRGKQAREAARKARDENDSLDDDAVRDRVRDRADEWRL